MKKFKNYKAKCILIIFISLFFPISSIGKNKKPQALWTCFNYKNDWSDWRKCTLTNNGQFFSPCFGDGYTLVSLSHTNYISVSRPTIYSYEYKLYKGNNSGSPFFSFKAYSSTDIPLDWESTREYDGEAIYYVTDELPNAEAIAKACRFVIPNPRNDKTPCVERTAKAKIKINYDSKQKYIYFTIFFDNIGIGIATDYFKD